jgi:hypothetical protein
MIPLERKRRVRVVCLYKGADSKGTERRKHEVKRFAKPSSKGGVNSLEDVDRIASNGDQTVLPETRHVDSAKC